MCMFWGLIPPLDLDPLQVGSRGSGPLSTNFFPWLERLACAFRFLLCCLFVCFCSLGWDACARGNFGFHDLTFEETEAQEEETLEWANRNMISVAWLTPAHNPFPLL